MGQLRIVAHGSFVNFCKEYSAQTSGHTVAIDDAIEDLKEMRVEAIDQDKKLRTDGHMPDDKFEEADRRELLK